MNQQPAGPGIWTPDLKQASSFFNKNLTNADNDNSMNMSTKMEMSQVNKQPEGHTMRGSPVESPLSYNGRPPFFVVLANIFDQLI